MMIFFDKNGKTYKILSDNLGSVRMVVDIQTGKTIQKISFFTKEPLGFAGSMNFYVYADGDSVNFVDVSGLKPGDLFQSLNKLWRDVENYTMNKYSDSFKYEFLAEIYISSYNKDGSPCYSYREPYTNKEHYFVNLKGSFFGKLPSRPIYAVWHNHVYDSVMKIWGTPTLSQDDIVLAERLSGGIFMSLFEHGDGVTARKSYGHWRY